MHRGYSKRVKPTVRIVTRLISSISCAEQIRSVSLVERYFSYLVLHLLGCSSISSCILLRVKLVHARLKKEEANFRSFTTVIVVESRKCVVLEWKAHGNRLIVTGWRVLKKQATTMPDVKLEITTLPISSHCHAREPNEVASGSFELAVS